MKRGYLIPAKMGQNKPLLIQGSQFTGTAFTNVFKDHDVKISMNGKGRATDNECPHQTFGMRTPIDVR